MGGRLGEDDIRQLLLIVKPHLESLNIDYWLGRGVLRQQYLTGRVGDRQSDLDVHIWAEDCSKVRDKFGPVLANHNFNRCVDRSYKLAFVNDSNHWAIEFMLLFSDSRDAEVVYHTRAEGVHLECPRRCFATTDASIEVAGIGFTAPSHIEQYLHGVYGTHGSRTAEP